jgi:translation initiation factor 3 subunit F
VQVEVTNCFAVPHAERGEEVAIGKDFNRQMLALHLRANRHETLVGWYATALPPSPEADASAGYRCIADTSSLMHEFYTDECEDDPIHLIMDTSLQTDSLAIRAYRSESVTILQEPVANIFHELRLVIRSSESEKIAMDKMTQSATTGVTLLASETNSLQVSLERLHDMLDTCSSYVDGVVSGEIIADDAVGRLMADTLASIPRIRPELFDKVFSDTLQDLLMVTYLSNMTRTQLTIAEKINALLDQPVK